LPPRGNGLIDPSLLTLGGSLRAASLNAAEYLPNQLIYRSGRERCFNSYRSIQRMVAERHREEQ